MKLLHFLLLLPCLWPAAAFPASQPPGAEYLLFQEIPSVYTASKTDQSVERATAVVTVISDEDIQRWGARTLYDVLKHIPGFFPSSQASWTVTGSRGLTSDSNDHILLLIDGHEQNSIVGQGYQQQDMLPVLQKVKKIEIVRGPGSVLWGSSAVFGIINIITKDGSNTENHVSTSYGARDGMFDLNIMRTLGQVTGGTCGSISFSYWQSQGYNTPDKSGGTSAAFSAAGANNVHANVEFPWGRIGDWPAIDQQDPGWEIYARLKFGADDELLGRIVESRTVYPWDTQGGNPGSELRMRKAYLDYRHHDTLGDHVILESTLYGDLLLQNRFPDADQLFQSGGGPNRDHMQDQSNEEEAFGGELSAKIRFTDQHRLTAGIKAVHAVIGPNRDARFDIATNKPASASYPYIGVESGNDNTEAGYFEDTWDINQARTTLFYGSRLEYNDFREAKAVFLPRAGLIHALTGNSTIKYVFNTGYLRPDAVYSKTTGVIVDTTRGPTQGILLVTRSERILNHEIQWYRRTDRNFLTANVFYMQISNYISFDANNTPQGYKNLGDAVSRGVEIEGRERMGRSWEVYGNYSFVKARLDDSQAQGALTNKENQTLNYPTHIVNLGATWISGDGKRTLNCNLNGWRQMWIAEPLNSDGSGGNFSRLRGEIYLDVTYHHPDLFARGLGLSVFCMNVFDNTQAVGMVVNNGVWFPRGRDLGAGIEYRW